MFLPGRHYTCRVYCLLTFLAWSTCCLAAPAQPSAWIPAESPLNIAYQTIDELRSFYKLSDSPRSSRQGVYTMLNDTTTVELGPGPRTLRINGVDIALGRPLMRNGVGKLLISRDDWVYWVDPILRPTYIADRIRLGTVIIDAAHGGYDTGAPCGTSRESQVVLHVALALQKKLEDAGIHCVLTRSGDYFLSDRQRVDQSNAMHGAIFVNLHLNKSHSEAAGPAVHVPAPVSDTGVPRPVEAFSCKSAALAYALQYMLSAELHLPGAGCRHVHYSILNSLSMPAVSVSLGYASNPREAAALTDAAYQARLANALARGVLNYARATDPQATIPVAAAFSPHAKAPSRKEFSKSPPDKPKTRGKPRNGRQNRARR